MLVKNYKILDKKLIEYKGAGSKKNEIKNIIEFENNCKIIDSFIKENTTLFSIQDYTGYTNQFIEYIARIKKEYNDFFVRLISSQYNIENEVNNLAKKVLKDSKIVIVLTKISFKNKNLVLLGANGSGKTSLAVFLQQSSQNIRVIPAFKPLYYKKDVHGAPSNTKISDYNNAINMNQYTNAHAGIDKSYQLFSTWETLFSKQVIGIINEHIEKALEYQKTGKKFETIFESVKKIFETIFMEIKIDVDSTDKVIKCSKKNGGTYDINGLSDGERSALFYIGTILTAPTDSYIIIDEPENHLNPAIYNAIWDELEIKRSDCQFIYISHTMDFVNSRRNYEIMTITEFTYPNIFEFDFIDPNKLDFPSELLVKVIGSKKPILFCEGTKDSYDYKLYQELFGSDYLVIPVESCDNVVNLTKTSLNLKRFFNGFARGIIDNDFLQPERWGSLIENNISVLKINEVEMILLDELLVKEVLRKKNSEYTPAIIQEKFNSFKEELITLILNRKEKIISFSMKKRFDTYSSNKKIVNITSIKTIKSEIDNYVVDFGFDDIFTNINSEISSIETTRDYDKCLIICNLKDEVLKGLCNRLIDNDYTNRALEIIRKDRKLANELLNKYIQ
ncbi:MAG: AAA family ATPase [Acholeplasmataceae bacterium]